MPSLLSVFRKAQPDEAPEHSVPSRVPLPLLGPLEISPSGPVATGSCVALRCPASGASYVKVTPDVGYIAAGFGSTLFAAPKESTTYEVTATNSSGSTRRRFTIEIDNTPPPVDHRSASRKIREKLCSMLQTYATSLDEVLPKLQARGGPMAAAATDIQTYLADLRYVCRPESLLQDSPSKPETFATAVKRIAGAMCGSLSEAEETIAQQPGWEPGEEEDVEARAVGNMCGALWSVADQLTGELREESLPKLEGIPA